MIRKIYRIIILLIIIFGIENNEVLSQDNENSERLTNWQCTYSDSVLIAESYNKSIENIASEKLINIESGKIKLIIHKTRYMLEFLSNSTILKRYPIALGFNPIDDKLQRGDGCTPEGEFYVCRKVNPSQYYKAFLFSYPNKEDAQRGLHSGIINNQQFNSIVSAIDEASTPPQHTRLGGLIEIHGEGVGYNWTLGCIAMENKDIDELWQYVNEDSIIEIFK